MVGDACVTTTVDGDNCDCTYDCEQDSLVQTQCTNLTYSPCTCASSDPCSWINDDYCDAECATLYPDDYFVDPGDCICDGACDPETFSGFCFEGDACLCDTDAMVEIDCEAFCTWVGADVDPEGACVLSSYDDSPECMCVNFSCNVPAEVDHQCTNYGYTPCTCAAADPCTWMTDDFCDRPVCNELFPEQTNFNDSASAACRE
jgi:hypothetical protein